MNKNIVIITIIAVLVASGVMAYLKNQEESKKKNNTVTNIVETEETEKEGYDINVSEKEITVEKGKETSFDVTFTIPDISTVREYIICKDQDDIVLVRYSDMMDRTIKVDVEGLKVGTTEIEICDFNYQDVKEIVKVNVVEEN